MSATTYVIGDIHGRSDLLRSAIAAVKSHFGSPKKLITLGDYVDRGPDSKGVIEILRTWSDPAVELTSLMGNHEQMMLHMLEDTDDALADAWLDNGGFDTLKSYGWRGGATIDITVVPDAVRVWLRGLPLVVLDDHRVYVHADADPDRPIEEQSWKEFLWKRRDNRDGRGHGSRHIVHGHTPQTRGPLLLAGRTNLDVGAFKTNRLVVGVFRDDVAGGPIETLEVRP